MDNFLVSSKKENTNLYLYINKIVHLFVKNWDHFLIGYTSYIDTSKEVLYYSIEITLKNGSILLEYDCKNKFDLILNELNKNI